MLVSSVIGSVISWPVAIVVVVYMLREPIKDLIRSLQSLAFEAGGVRVGVDVRERLDEAKQEAEEAQVPQLQEHEAIPDQPYRGVDEYGWLYELTERYPRSAVIEAWVLIEHEVRELARRTDLAPGRRRSIISMLNTLAERDIVPPGLASLASDLSSVRNSVVHERATAISTEQAIEYVNLSLRIANYLRDLLTNNERMPNRRPTTSCRPLRLKLLPQL